MPPAIVCSADFISAVKINRLLRSCLMCVKNEPLSHVYDRVHSAYYLYLADVFIRATNTIKNGFVVYELRCT